MSKILRCSRCFAPKDEADDICGFCGLDPRELQREKSIAAFGDELMREFLEESLPDGLSLDEKIARLEARRRR